MTIELRYGTQSFRVAPVGVENGQITMEIDGQEVKIPLDKVAAVRPAQVSEPLPDTPPTHEQLIAMFLPAAQNQIVAPTIRHEGEPLAEDSVARDLGITPEELRRWKQLFTDVKNPPKT